MRGLRVHLGRREVQDLAYKPYRGVAVRHHVEHSVALRLAATFTRPRRDRQLARILTIFRVEYTIDRIPVWAAPALFAMRDGLHRMQAA